MRRLVFLALCLVALVAAVVRPAVADHPGDRTGVDEGSITIGIHVPETGPSPVGAGAVGRGAELYWRWLHDVKGELVHGRRVQVVARDDGSSPTNAVAVCNDLSTEAFLLVGFAGADQIAACGAFASPRGIPYLANGTSGSALEGRSSSFALSAVYADQAPIVAEFIVNRLGGSVDRYGSVPITLPILDLPLPLLTQEGPDGAVTVALVRRNVPSANEAEQSLRTELQALGRDLDFVHAVVKDGNGEEAVAVARNLRSEGVDVVVTETGATFTSLLVLRAAQDGYEPGWLTLGMTSGIDAFARVICGNAGAQGVSSFSPWPAVTDVLAGDFDPEFAAAVDALDPDLGNDRFADVSLAGWAMMKGLHAILEAAGADVTRSDLIAMLDAGYAHSTGVYPDFAVSSEDHTGATAVHRLELRCDEGEGRWREREAFVTEYPAP